MSKITINDINKCGYLENSPIDQEKDYTTIIHFNEETTISEIIHDLHTAIIYKYKIHNECVEIASLIFQKQFNIHKYNQITIYYLDLAIVKFNNINFPNKNSCFRINVEDFIKKKKNLNLEMETEVQQIGHTLKKYVKIGMLSVLMFYFGYFYRVVEEYDKNIIKPYEKIHIING